MVKRSARRTRGTHSPAFKAQVALAAMPRRCKTTDLKVEGDRVTVTSVCSGKENVGTTTYHGDSLETTNTNGAQAQSKRVGPCSRPNSGRSKRGKNS